MKHIPFLINDDEKLFRQLLNLWPILIFFGIVIFLETRMYFRQKIFYENEINSIIIKKTPYLSGAKMSNYITRNNIKIVIQKPDCSDLNVGDSVVKEKNSWVYSVFKQNVVGKYVFYKTCNYKIRSK